MTLGIMPPEITPEAMWASTSARVSSGMSLPLASSTPGTSVTSTKQWALSAPATAPAAESALTLRAEPSLDTATGAMTGT